MVFTSCNICGSNECHEICGIEISPFLIRSKLVKCAKCGFYYANPRLEQGAEEELYSRQYYQDETEGRWYELRISVFKRFLRESSRFLKKGRLLDIGCGMGYFMDLAKNDGWEVKGTDISDYAVNYAREKFGSDIIKGDLEDAHFEREYFDAVTMWNVLDQVYDPKAVLAEANRVLKKGGYIFIRVSNLYFHLKLFKFYNSLKFLFKKIYLAPSVFHLYSFDKKSTERLLEATGFSVIAVKIEPMSAESWYIIEMFNKRCEKIIRRAVNFMAIAIYFLSFRKIIMSPSIFLIAQKI